MANIIEIYNEITSFGLLDTSITMSSPLALPQNGVIKMQVCSLTLSDRIPNVFNANPYYQFNNTLLRVRSNLQGWQTLQLPVGLYPDPNSIGIGIANAIGQLGWWLNNANPGFSISVNTITDRVTVYIDSGKLGPIAGDELSVDLRKVSTGTDLATTLGFSQPNALFFDTGLWFSDSMVKLDTQGTTCDVQSSLVTSRRRNNKFIKTLANVVFAGKTTVSDNVWPLGGQITPILMYDGNRTITGVNLEMRTMEGRPMFFMSGAVHIVVSFIF
jgi:hypothetical protein